MEKKKELELIYGMMILNMKGEWKDNLMDGYGIYYFKNGRIYKGQWKDSKIQGYGEFTWVEGKKYYGFYQKDKKDGFGIYYWPEEKFFIGFWKEGKQHGISKYIKGNQIKYCRWKNGKKDKIYLNEDQFFNCFEPEEEKYLVYFKWDINKIKEYMEIK